MYSSGGIRAFPFASTGGRISNAARTLAITIYTTFTAKYRPGQTLYDFGQKVRTLDRLLMKPTSDQNQIPCPQGLGQRGSSFHPW